MSSPNRRNNIINGLFILLLMVGVFSDKEQNITKQDGETVTLYVNTSWQNSKTFLWNFGHHNPVIAISIVTNGEVTRVNGTRFENRLHTDVETGSITIFNLTTNDTGIFAVQYLMETGILRQTFNLSVHDNQVIPTNILEGGNVTLDVGVKELEKDINVKWTQGPNFADNRIAEWKDNNIFIDEHFKNVLQLNPHTGSLTFIRVTKNYTGPYCVKYLLGPNPHILSQFLLTVLEPVLAVHICSPKVTEHSQNDGSCHINCCVKNAPELTLTWYKGQEEINQTSNPDISTNLSLPLEIQDEGMYRCVAANPVINETIFVNSTQWCPAHADSSMIGWIIGGVGAALVVVVLAGLGYKFCPRRQRNNQRAEKCYTVTYKQDDSESGNDPVENTNLLRNREKYQRQYH